MSNYKKDMISALVFFVIAIFVLISVPLTVIDPHIAGIGPREFPYFVGWAMLFLSILMALKTYILNKKEMMAQDKKNDDKAIENEISKDEVSEEKSKVEKLTNRKNELRAFAVALLMLLYAFSFDKLGYFISTFVISTAILAMFKVKKPLSYIITYAVAGLIYLAFTVLLSVRLP